MVHASIYTMYICTVVLYVAVWLLWYCCTVVLCIVVLYDCYTWSHLSHIPSVLLTACALTDVFVVYNMQTCYIEHIQQHTTHHVTLHNALCTVYCVLYCVYCTVVLWYCGTVVLWYCGIVVLYDCMSVLMLVTVLHS